MQTATGRVCWPIDPRPEDIYIEDIAHALAHQCRYGGHCQRFYSVAEHSILVSRLVPKEHALAGLLHDASEAYCVDVPAPLKRQLVGYKEIEKLNWNAICDRFGLLHRMPTCVHHADVAMLFAEQKALMLPSPRPDWGMGRLTPMSADPASIVGYSPVQARRLFLERFNELHKE